MACGALGNAGMEQRPTHPEGLWREIARRDVGADRCIATMRAGSFALVGLNFIGCQRQLEKSLVICNAAECKMRSVPVSYESVQAVLLQNLTISVLLVDDFVQFRAAVSTLLRKKPELQIVAEASDGIEAVEQSRQLQPDLILLDIGLPKLNGIAAAQQIREVAPQSKIIFVTQETSADIMKEAIGLGGMGYVVKSKVESELLKAIDRVLEGKQFIGTGLTGNP